MGQGPGRLVVAHTQIWQANDEVREQERRGTVQAVRTLFHEDRAIL